MLKSIGGLPRVVFELAYYDQIVDLAKAACVTKTSISNICGHLEKKFSTFPGFQVYRGVKVGIGSGICLEKTWRTGMARFKKSTVVLLTAGTLTLGSLGVLASQQGTPGTFGHDTWERMNSTYNYSDTSTKNHNWFDRNWFDRWRGHQNDRSMMHRNCSCGMCRQAGRIKGVRTDNTLPPIDKHSPNESGVPSTTELSGANPQEFGRSLVADIGCQVCHQIGRSGGMFGPPLNDVVSRQGEAFVHSKLENPKFETGYSKMPDFNLSSEEITAIVAYLATLDDA